MLNRYDSKLYKYTLYIISTLSNTYCVESTIRHRQTETSQDKLRNKCIHDSYCLPIITMLGMLLLTTTLTYCYQCYIRGIFTNKQGNKNNKNKQNIPIRYVVSDVYDVLDIYECRR